MVSGEGVGELLGGFGRVVGVGHDAADDEHVGAGGEGVGRGGDARLVVRRRSDRAIDSAPRTPVGQDTDDNDRPMRGAFPGRGMRTQLPQPSQTPPRHPLTS